jgi:hypothetical protein
MAHFVSSNGMHPTISAADDMAIISVARRTPAGASSPLVPVVVIHGPKLPQAIM